MRKLKTPLALLVVTLMTTGCGKEEAQPAATAPLADATPAVEAPAAAPMASGQEIYDLYCVHCHAAGGGHPGTAMLGELHGPEKAVIKGRADLTPDYIKAIVRNGLVEMPPFRPTEISDAELESVAEYVKQP